MELLWKVLLTAGSILVAIAGSLGIVKWKHDNPLEESVEMVIKQETGLDVDLSPQDPDPDFLDRHMLDMQMTFVSDPDDEIVGI